jgi:hypothetical protein
MAMAGKKRVFTIGQWAPGLRTMVNSTVAPCGCLVGVYVAWRGETVAVVDQPHARCAAHHRVGDVAEDVSAATPAQRV